MASWARLALLSGTLAVAACGGGDEKSGSGGAGSAGGSAGGASGASGGGAGGAPATPVSKGPWVLAVDATSAKIRWETREPTIDPSVTLTPDGAEPRVVAADFSPFDVLNTYKAPLNPNAPPDEAGTYYMHEAALTGLAESTCHAYSLSHATDATGRFCTSRSSGETFSFLAIADTNPSLLTNTVELMPHLTAEGFDFTVHAGDLQYYDSLFETWASWAPLMEPMLRAGALFPAIGNHEVEMDDEQDQYYVRFFGGAGFDGTDAYYRFEHGGVWFFVLNTEDDVSAGTTQFSWFTEQLADAAAKPGYRFGVVAFHKPFITCGDKSQNSGARSQYEPFFEQHGVRIVLQGHMHGYERFEVPLAGDAAKSITYLTVGGGGGLLGTIDENADRAECAMRLSSGRFYHGTVVEVTPSGYRGRTIDKAGAVRDEFEHAL